jgi:5-formyltetrahydrofolate cyclo-ligase
MDKDFFRKKILDIRNSLSQKEVEICSDKIWKSLSKLKEFQEAKGIFIYISFKNEVDTNKIIQSIIDTKQVMVPCIENGKINISQIDNFCTYKKDKFGIPEPCEKKICSPKKIDLAIVPGIAFDLNRNRIGFGGGYYDRILKLINAKKIALCYDFQLLDNIPIDNHDIKMDFIITESRMITN